MSSRIIRPDGRRRTTGGSLVGVGATPAPPQNHIMDVEKQAFEQGYAEGQRIGKQMGEAMIETICKRYEKGLAELAASHRQMAQAMEEQTVKLSLEIARKIVQREMAMDPDLIATLAAVALKRLASHQSIILKVSRHDFDRVRAAIAATNPAVTVKDDPALDRGDFMIETAQTYLDGRIPNQIDAIGRALLDE
jgi:flagellar assembly protein FliH